MRTTASSTSNDRQIDKALLALRAGDPARAKSCCRKVLHKDSRNFNALQLMAMALRAESQYLPAIDFFKKAARAAPVKSLVSQIHIEIAASHDLNGDSTSALTVLDRLLSQDLTNTTALHLKAVILRAIGDEQAALECFKQIVIYPPAICSGAQLTRGKAHWNLLTSPQLQPTQADIEAALADLDWIEDEGERAHLYFAIYNGYERNRHYESAWDALNKANALVWQRVECDIGQINRDMENLYQQIVAMPAPAVPEQQQSYHPVYICGLPRSGTTLLESILLEHPEVESRGETMQTSDCHAACIESSEPNSSAAIDRFKVELDKYLKPCAEGSSVVIDKTPNNFIYAPALLQALPGLRILNPIKSPQEACFSLYRQHFLQSSAHAYSYDLQSTVLFFRWHEKIMKLLQQRFPQSVLNVDYADLAAGESTVWTEVFKFCGLQWKAEFLNYDRSSRRVDTISAAQIRQGLSKNYRHRGKAYGTVIHQLHQLLGLSIAQLQEKSSTD